MKKEHIYKSLYVIAIIFILIFSITISIDYFNYDIYTNSAPFYTFVIVRCIEFLLPSIIFFTVGKFIKIKS